MVQVFLCFATAFFLRCGGGARGDESRERIAAQKVATIGIAAYAKSDSAVLLHVCALVLLCNARSGAEGSRMQRGVAQCGCYPCCLTCARDSKPILGPPMARALRSAHGVDWAKLSSARFVGLTRSTRLCRHKYSCDRCSIRVPRIHAIDPQQVQKPLKRSVGSEETAFNSSAAWFL